MLSCATFGSAGKVNIPTMEIAPGVHMPVLSIGTGGRAKWNHTEADTILKGWLEVGGTGIDTAWIYGTEDQLPKSFRDVNANRSELFILSKVPGCFMAESFVERNLKALATDYIDLLLIHSPAGWDCKGTWKVLEDLHRKGVVRAIGVSNFNEENLRNIMEVATVTPAVNQIEFNVMKHDASLIAYCQANKIVPMAYSPLGDGSAHNAVVGQIAASHNLTSYQVALKWIVQHGMLVTFQTTKTSHMISNADIFGFNLTAQELRDLDAQVPSNVFV